MTIFLSTTLTKIVDKIESNVIIIKQGKILTYLSSIELKDKLKDSNFDNFYIKTVKML